MGLEDDKEKIFGRRLGILAAIYPASGHLGLDEIKARVRQLEKMCLSESDEEDSQSSSGGNPPKGGSSGSREDGT